MMPALREGAARAQKQATVMVSSGRVTGDGVVAKNPNFLRTSFMHVPYLT